MAGRHVALIRGINVGRAKRVAMADLRVLVADLGYRDVRTLLNGGNIVFTVPPKSPDDAAIRIEHALASRLGVSARVTVLTAAELAAAMADNPLCEITDNPSRLLVFVLADPSDRSKLQPLTEQEWAPEAIAIGRRVAYLWCPAGIVESPLAAAVGRKLGDAVTARNWATMTKLHTLVGQ
jgi:uncharacterized protein (DUF1697 family)